MRKRLRQTPGKPHCHRCKTTNPPDGFASNGYCRPCSREYAHTRYYGPQHERLKAQWRNHARKNYSKYRARSKQARWQLKVDTLAAYGGICACCGEAEPMFLGIDHISGGGTKHRRELGGGGRFYRFLKINDWPSGYRVLCHNCNMAYGFFGQCPHTKQGTASQSA